MKILLFSFLLCFSLLDPASISTFYLSFISLSSSSSFPSSCVLSTCIPYLTSDHRLSPIFQTSLAVQELIAHLYFAIPLVLSYLFPYCFPTTTSNERYITSVTGLYFNVTSSSHSIDDIHKAIFAFGDAVPSLIHAISPEVYQNHVNTQINRKSRADPSLYDAAAFNWYEITEGKVDFALRAKQAELLKNPNSLLLQQKGLEQFATDLLKSARRLLVVHAELSSAAPPSKSPAQSITFGSLCPNVEVVHVKSASEVHSLGTIVVPLSQDKR